MPVCSHCGFEAGDVPACPLCGSSILPSVPPGPGHRECPHEEAQTRLPEWEDPVVSFPRNLTGTWIRSLMNPGHFYAGVPFQAPVMRPLLYFLIVTIVSAAFNLWLSAIGVSSDFVYESLGYESMMDSSSTVINFWLTPFVSLGVLIAWTLILHLFVLILAPERRGPGATARVLCYSVGPSIFTLVPIVGTLVGAVWGIVLQVVGIRTAHRTTTGRAALVVILPTVLLGITLFFLMVAALGLASLAV